MRPASGGASTHFTLYPKVDKMGNDACWAGGALRENVPRVPHRAFGAGASASVPRVLAVGESRLASSLRPLIAKREEPGAPLAWTARRSHLAHVIGELKEAIGAHVEGGRDAEDFLDRECVFRHEAQRGHLFSGVLLNAFASVPRLAGLLHQVAELLGNRKRLRCHAVIHLSPDSSG